MKKLSAQEAVGLVTAIQAGNGVAVMNGRKVRSRVIYAAGLAANLPATGDVIEQKTVKEIGLTNFDGGNKLNDGRNLLVVGIRLLFDTNAAVTAKGASFLSAAPANFKNGELLISQEGSGNLFEGPIGPLACYNASIPTEEQFRGVVPFLIRPNATFNIRILLAAAAAADQAYKIELDCIEFMDGDKG